MLEEGGTGQLILIVAPRKSETKDKWAYRSHTISTWIQATKIGLDAIMDNDEMLVLATSLNNGARLEGFEVGTPGAFPAVRLSLAGSTCSGCLSRPGSC